MFVSILLLFTLPAFAGGSSVPVRVLKLTMLSDTDFVLVVLREPDCTRFEVRGTFGRLHSDSWLDLRPQRPTLEKHIASLQALQTAADDRSVIKLGWWGTGFKVIDPETPCVVESRALELFKEHSGSMAIYSYYNMI